MQPSLARTGGTESAARHDGVALIVADHDPLARAAVREELANRTDLKIVGEATDTAEAITLVLRFEPDVVLMDADLPPDGGLAATLKLHEIDVSLHIVLFHVRDDEELAIAGLDAGADGFLCKDIGMTSLARALNGVARGQAAISRHLTLHVITRLRTMSAQLRHARPLGSPLTERQWEVIDLLAQGRREGEIAEELHVSAATIRGHVRMLRRSLGARTHAEAVEKAERLRTGSLPVPNPQVSDPCRAPSHRASSGPLGRG